MNKITTRRGDKGQTDLLDHQRVNKTDCRIEANGEIDELMALLGMLKAQPELPESMRIKIEHIQMMLMAVMKHVASSGATQVDILQADIDDMERNMNETPTDPSFRFVLPGHSPIEALMQLVRAKVRTVERRLCAVNAVIPLSPTVMVYVNRLSDYLFVMALQA